MNGWMDRIGRDWMMDGMGRDEIDGWMNGMRRYWMDGMSRDEMDE